MNHPPQIAAILSQQIKNPASKRALQRLKTPFAGVLDEKKRQAMIRRRSAAGQKATRKKRKGGNKGSLRRLLEAYRNANMMDHPNAVELQRQIETL